MIRLLLSDLRHHAGSWAWTAVVAVVAASAVAGQFRVAHGAFAAAEAAGDPTMIDGAESVSGIIIIGVVFAAVAILSSTSNLAVSQRERDHGLWKALGMSPSMVRLVIQGQLLALGTLASLAAVPLSLPISRFMMHRLVSDGAALPGAVPQWKPADLIWTAIISAGTLVMGGRGAAKRASRTPEALLLRGSGGQRAHWSAGRVLKGLLRLLWAAAAAAGWVAEFLVIRNGTNGEDIFLAVFSGALSGLILVCILCSWLSPVLERLLSALVPSPGVAWHVAGRTCALESRRSAATVLPFVVTIGLVAIAFGPASVSPDVSADAFSSVFGLPFLVSWTGGVAVIAMSAGRRRRDAALLRAAGAMERDVLAIEVLEGFLHAAAATILGLLVTLSTAVLLSEALHRSLAGILADFPWTTLGLVCAATLATTCLAVVVSARAGALAGEQALGQVLRARD
ncbi:FtsX-like permease family protein [Actinomyces naeslundii]|jgi:putative ABC transporter permease protein|uniref:Efflux ABC transporter, permease protein n=2 Tax=Actinomyces naeslundii TaxID=1655 RepID=J3ABX6_ACTNH|nr:ABC transporter permease [Actinomyces naeslundii]EJN85323.1 efflux ABC transporter, permease protein [Actinomyces naeslundii str. Howell 279]OMG36738.1 ABC transporter permease [Actinomyces naeslundii]QQC21847.1 ABC transporter permease [Actinomyces naeslundii]